MTTFKAPSTFEMRADWKAALLMALFVAVIGGALALRPSAVAGGTEPAYTGTSTAGQAAGGVAWAIVEALFAVALLAGILLWDRVPEWVQETVKTVVKFIIPFAIGVIGALLWTPGAALASALATIILVKALDAAGLYWLVNDVLALALAIYIGVVAGIVFGVVILAVGVIGLTAYDYYFADRKPWMETLAVWTIRRRVPALFIAPATARFDWSKFVETLNASDDDRSVRKYMAFGIGMADLALPAAFAVAVAHSGGGLPLAGAIAGTLVACLRVSWKIEQGVGAGLPPLMSGALGGWAIAAIVGVIAV